ncbi:hypothetical protein GE09DRAFT_208228 [Coniochaeta sp. 2T2.1]|nr:hypothetical protein GE09DRAFT_208228 [Coniochaeta sp. 2T2.1]
MHYSTGMVLPDICRPGGRQQTRQQRGDFRSVRVIVLGVFFCLQILVTSRVTPCGSVRFTLWIAASFNSIQPMISISTLNVGRYATTRREGDIRLDVGQLMQPPTATPPVISPNSLNTTDSTYFPVSPLTSFVLQYPFLFFYPTRYRYKFSPSPQLHMVGSITPSGPNPPARSKPQTNERGGKQAVSARTHRAQGYDSVCAVTVQDRGCMHQPTNWFPALWRRGVWGAFCRSCSEPGRDPRRGLCKTGMFGTLLACRE